MVDVHATPPGSNGLSHGEDPEAARLLSQPASDSIKLSPADSASGQLLTPQPTLSGWSSPTAPALVPQWLALTPAAIAPALPALRATAEAGAWVAWFFIADRMTIVSTTEKVG